MSSNLEVTKGFAVPPCVLVQGRKIIIEERFFQKTILQHWLGFPREVFEATPILTSMKEEYLEHATKM